VDCCRVTRGARDKHRPGNCRGDKRRRRISNLAYGQGRQKIDIYQARMKSLGEEPPAGDSTSSEE